MSSYTLVKTSEPFMTVGRGLCVEKTIHKILTDNCYFKEYNEYIIKSNDIDMYPRDEFGFQLYSLSQEFINEFKPIPFTVHVTLENIKWKMNKKELYKKARFYYPTIENNLSKKEYAEALMNV